MNTPDNRYPREDPAKVCHFCLSFGGYRLATRVLRRRHDRRTIRFAW